MKIILKLFVFIFGWWNVAAVKDLFTHTKKKNELIKVKEMKIVG